LIQDPELQKRIQRLTVEDVTIVGYDPAWTKLFRQERDHLRACLPNDLVKRIEHFGSTAIPGLAAKPVVDILVEVSDLEATKTRIAPVLESQGYDYIWRPTHGDDGPPFYAWFIKRHPATRTRTHHIHMVEANFEHWDSLLFRDYLIERPDVAREYQQLKMQLASEYPNDRVAYTNGKSAFVERVTADAKRHYRVGAADDHRSSRTR
jgi:GrpB-like predicted nucleotidyltransferase (UPF0157 family)